MTSVPPHHADRAAVERGLEIGRSSWQRHLRRALEAGGDISKRGQRARDLLGPAALLGTEAEVQSALRGVARTAAMHLALIRAPELPFLVRVGDTSESIEGPRDADLLYLTDWLDGFSAALAIRDEVTLGLLLPVPDELWSDGREAPGWRQTVDFLRGLYLGSSEPDPAAQARALGSAALDGMGADVTGFAQANLVPMLDAWATLLGGGDLTRVLIDGLQAHAHFWPSVESVDQPKGYVALWLLGVAAQAWDRGLRVQLDTPYLPAFVVSQGGPGMVIACPYCVTPMDAETEQCAACFEDPRRDAPFEMSLDEVRMRKSRCPHCAYPLHQLAVRCGRCARPSR